MQALFAPHPSPPYSPKSSASNAKHRHSRTPPPLSLRADDPASRARPAPSSQSAACLRHGILLCSRLDASPGPVGRSFPKQTLHSASRDPSGLELSAYDDAGPHQSSVGPRRRKRVFRTSAFRPSCLFKQSYPTLKSIHYHSYSTYLFIQKPS